MSEQMTLLGISPRPTKKYIASLMRSEDLQVNADLVEICQEGWIDAANDDDEERRRRVLIWGGPWEYNMDIYTLGYTTFVYTYTGAMVGYKVRCWLRPDRICSKQVTQ